MESRAQLKYLRIAPRKVRLVADLVRDKSVPEARALLSFTLKKSARPMKKLLDSAIANAVNNLELDESTLKISKLVVDGGPMLKRWRPRSRGRAFEIQKKTSHITICLEGEKKKVAKKKSTKKEEKAI